MIRFVGVHGEFVGSKLDERPERRAAEVNGRDDANDGSESIASRLCNFMHILLSLMRTP